MPLPDVIVLWDLPAEEWPAWIDAGCGALTFGEYTQKLAGVVEGLRADGHRVELVRATVAEVLAVLDELGLAAEPNGLAAAIGVIHTRRTA